MYTGYLADEHRLLVGFTTDETTLYSIKSDTNIVKGATNRIRCVLRMVVSYSSRRKIGMFSINDILGFLPLHNPPNAAVFRCKTLQCLGSCIQSLVSTFLTASTSSMM